MRKIFAVLVMACILVTGCGSAKAEQTTPAQAEQVAVEATTEQAHIETVCLLTRDAVDRNE